MKTDLYYLGALIQSIQNLVYQAPLETVELHQIAQCFQLKEEKIIE